MSSIECALALVDKPTGVTSHDVVYTVRRRLRDLAGGRKVKIGHAGTLDPFATGLLVILVGRATRLQRYLLHQDKRYRVVARLGWRSDTGDVDGELVDTGRVPQDPRLPCGTVELPVPAYSAIKVDGQRLYAKARRGEEFEPPLREMTVYRAERMDLSGERATFEIDCAGGTYVRSLVATLEDAYCEQLVRTRVGDLRLDDAVAPGDLSLGDLIDPRAALAGIAELVLDHDDARAVIHGRALPAGELAEDAAASLLVDGRLLGVGRAVAGTLKPETVLAGSLEELLAR